MIPLVAPFVLITCLAAEPAEVKSATPTVEVVFVLDTTGSMGGLIQAAKDKIWSISNTLIKTKPVPALKIGLVGYRDRGDAYVTKVIPLSDDLDAVYRELIAFQAEGGGDGPESVNQALHEAVTKFPWSKDKSTYRVVFLVGDCPPHMDYQDDVKYPETCQLAAKAGIVINTIQCGADGSTEPIWTDIALKSEGKYFRVEQDGNAIVATTPFDEELAKLALKLDETCWYYGAAEVQMEQRGRKESSRFFADTASTAANAQRAVFNATPAGKVNLIGKAELVDDVTQGKIKLADIPKDELPAALKPLPAKDQEEAIRKQATARTELQKKISELGAKRQAHLEVLAAKSEKPVLEKIIFESVRDQAKRVGLIYAEGPAF